MRTLNEITEQYSEEKKLKILKNEIEHSQIKKVLDFFKEYSISKWSFSKAHFGENFKFIKFESNEDEYKTIQFKKSFSFEDIEKFKGLNYGRYEFGAPHFCIISTYISNKNKTILVIPMTSFKNNKSKRDILLSPKEYPFLKNETLLHIGRIQEIGLERFLINEIKREIIVPGTKTPYTLKNNDINQAKNIISDLFLK